MTYIVEAGDSLSAIAVGYTGDASRYTELLAANPQITDPNQIEIGEMLNIPDSWTSGSGTAPAVNTAVAAASVTPSQAVSSTIIKIALVGALAAGAYYWYGQNKVQSVALNPQFDEDYDDYEDEEDEEEDEE